jgi:hypothetical protein
MVNNVTLELIKVNGLWVLTGTRFFGQMELHMPLFLDAVGFKKR